jgi:hypothetical protein
MASVASMTTHVASSVVASNRAPEPDASVPESRTTVLNFGTEASALHAPLALQVVEAAMAQRSPANAQSPLMAQSWDLAQPSTEGTQLPPLATQLPDVLQVSDAAQPSAVATQLTPSKPQRPLPAHDI